MRIDQGGKYLRTMKGRYLQANSKERGRLFDEMGAVTRDQRPHEVPRVYDEGE